MTTKTDYGVGKRVADVTVRKADGSTFTRRQTVGTEDKPAGQQKSINDYTGAGLESETGSGASLWDRIEPGEEEMFDQCSYSDAFIDTVQVYRSDDGALSATATIHTSMLDAYSDLDEDAAEQQLNRHQKAIEEWLADTYGATDGGSEWADAAIEFRVSDDDVDRGASFPSDLEDVVALLNEQTGLTDLDNDLNGGYRNNGRMYGFHDSLRNHLDALDAATDEPSDVQPAASEPAEKPKNGYITMYKGKKYEVYANTSYEAQQIATAQIQKASPRARVRSSDVDVYLAELAGEQVTHTITN